MGLRKKMRRLLKILRPIPSHGTSLSFPQFGWLLAREPGPVNELVETPGEAADDRALVHRVMVAYRQARAAYANSSSFWDNSVRQLNADIDAALNGDDEAEAARLLRDPARNTHFWGFDAICTAPEGRLEPHQEVLSRQKTDVPWQTLYAMWLHDALTTLAEAVGAKLLDYPESGDLHRRRAQTPDELLDEIERTLGVPLRFPNPYAGELGLPMRRGVVGFRSIQSLYQGWRIAKLAAGRPGFRVLEIGAGLGRTAFFAVQFGVRDYTIVDIPLTGAAQGYFLGRTLGDKAVSLFGEPAGGTVSIVPPPSILGSAQRFDLIVNIDSLTEMSAEVAGDYWSFIKGATPTFLSINHEVNPFTVRSIYLNEPNLSVTRGPYWLRRGYVEEIVTFPANA